MSSQWISVEERLPEEWQDVLIVCNKRDLMAVAVLANYHGGPSWFVEGCEHPIEGITHWMPLPAPPNICDKCGKPPVAIIKFVDPDKPDLNFCQQHADEHSRGA